LLVVWYCWFGLVVVLWEMCLTTVLFD